MVIVPILLYHHIGNSTANSQYYVSPAGFEEQMKLLRDWQYVTITTEMLVQAILDGAPLPPRPIMITFDDGNLDNYTTAFPIMQKYGFTGVLYIVDNYMNTPNYMSAGQIWEMAGAGWEVGSHSRNHVDLTLVDTQRQKYEIVDSRIRLTKELGLPILSFAHPYGVSNHSVMDYAEFSGYIAGMGLGFTNDQGRGNLFTLQRRGVKGIYDLKQFAALLSWQGDPKYLSTGTPAP
jgi:peptidoglycan/xylan/chitin deacetylase (PgdA/CDA1 family)